MLDKFRETAITWDKANRKIYEPLRASAGDNKGRKLSVQVVNGGVIESLSGASLSLFWETKDKAYKGLDAFTAVDATKGEFEIYYTTGMLSNEGTLNANLVLVDTSGRVVSEPFTINVFKGIDDDAIQSSDSFTALTEALAQVGTINNKADRAELLALESTFEKTKVSLEQQLQQTADVIAGYDTALAEYSYDQYEPPTASDEWKTDTTGRILNMSSATFLSTFYDNYIGTHSDGLTVTKTSKGKDQSGQYDLYEYDFKPASYSKTALLSSAMHTYELPASFGLAHLIKHMMITPVLHPVFEWLRKNVRIKVIPIVNPWGWNQNPKVYGNKNGVNINRNFDSEGQWETFPVYSPNPADPNYNEWNVKGSAPFSEAETRILREWVLENKGAEFWIDCHTGLKAKRLDIWVYGDSKSPNFPNVKKAVAINQARIEKRYGKVAATELEIDPPGMVRQRWSVNEGNMPTMTMEFSELQWGTSLNNEGADITEYEAQLLVYILTLLNYGTHSFTRFVEMSGDFMSKLELILKSGYVLAKDDFSGANGLLHGKTTPVGDKQWSSSQPNLGMKIENGKAKANSVYVSSHSLIDAGATDMEVSARITFGSYAGLYVRTMNDANNLMVRMNTSNIAVYDGTTIATHTFTPTTGSEYLLKVSVKGPDLQAWLDGVLIIETKVPETGYTGAGLRTSNDTTSTFDDFTVKLI